MISTDSLKYLYYDHDNNNNYTLTVKVEDFDADPVQAQITKWLGPHNINGKKLDGTVALDEEKLSELTQILNRYDLEAWSKLPSLSCVSGTVRSLTVHLKDGTKYYIAWNAKFPKVFPPTEDVMYFELFNFFNGMIREAGWAEVVGDDIKDPRENPAYAPRTVSWFGNQVKLKIGTGTFYEDGRNAEIDYEGKSWWIEEGFVGYYTGENGASMSVVESGEIKLYMDGEEWHGHAGNKRIYKRHAEIGISCGDKSRWCELHTLGGENYDKIQITCMPGPVPAPQFTPISIVLYRCKDRFCRSCGGECEPADRYCRKCGGQIGFIGKTEEKTGLRGFTMFDPQLP